MTRRTLFAAMFQGSYPGTPYRDYSRQLPDYLRQLSRDAYARRNREIAALTSVAAIERRQRWVTETFWSLVGGMPERTPLNTREVGGFERAGYRVQKLIYESRPGLHVTANLYIPAGPPPYPGVLFQMGHSPNGKAWPSYQRCCQGLVKLGYLVLAFDPMGQGERVYYPGPDGRTRLRSSDEEHSFPGRQMILLGESSVRFQVWDSIRGLDVLASHPLVDPARLASTGQSGGGTTTMLLAAVDSRLRAAAVLSGNTENLACADFNPPGSTDDAEQNFIGGGPLGFDRWDLLYPHAPKPLFVSVSDKDAFGTYSPAYVSNGWEEFRKLKAVYARLGKSALIEWNATPLPHGLGHDTRLALYRWFEKHLKGGVSRIDREPPVNPEAEEVLLCTSAGNAVKTLKGQTPYSLLPLDAKAAKPLALRELIRYKEPRGTMKRLRTAPLGPIDAAAIEIASVEGVDLPAWLFAPPKFDAMYLILDPGGRNTGWQEDALYQSLAAKGFAVCALDVRGIGDLLPEFGRGAAGHARSHQVEEDYAWASMMLGAPLVGQRTSDVAAAIRGLKGLARTLIVAARGRMTVPALFAASLEPGIAALYLAGGLADYRGLTAQESYQVAQFANFVPGILRHTDLPQVASSVAARLVLGGTIDGAGDLMALDRVRALYPKAEVHVAAGWSVETLVGLAK